MTQSHIHELPAVDALVYSATRSARSFATFFDQVGIEIADQRIRREVLDTLELLHSGTPFEHGDRAGLRMIGAVIRDAADERRPGYGERALTRDTRYDQLFDPELDDLRLLALTWRELMNALDRCDDRVTAERHARKLVRTR